jgi:predicted DNA-binding protein (UPF0251 family)
MGRPPWCRRVEGSPPASLFKPAGIPARELQEVVMTLDEFEALRLSDHLGFYQEEAAVRMRVSRPTLGRILETARRKVAEALVLGKVLRIEGGPVHALRQRTLSCSNCGHEQNLPESESRPSLCPQCGSDRFACAPVLEPGTCGPGRRCRGRSRRARSGPKD